MGVKAQKYGGPVSKNYFIIKKINELGITQKYNGYYFLIDILDMLMNEYPVIRSFSREIYPVIAKKYNINQAIIERDIRNVIKKLWQPVLKNKLKQFWDKDSVPSCCKFIYLIKNYLIMEIA